MSSQDFLFFCLVERVIAVNRSGPLEVCGAVRASGTGRRAGRRPREIAPGMISVVEEKSEVVSPSPRGNAFMHRVWDSKPDIDTVQIAIYYMTSKLCRWRSTCEVLEAILKTEVLDWPVVRYLGPGQPT